MSFLVLVLAALAVEAPVEAPLAALDDAALNLKRVRTRGTVVESFTDEVAPDTHFLVLKDRGDFLIAYLPSEECGDVKSLLEADVEVTGVMNRTVTGSRNYLGPLLSLNSRTDIRVLSPPPADPFDVPLLEQKLFSSPREVERRGRQRLTGRVLATWHGDRLMMSGGTVVRLVRGSPLPKPGETVTVAGYPHSNLFRINLIRASWKAEPAAGSPPDEPTPLSAARATADTHGRTEYKAPLHGRTVRIRGTVRRLPPSPDGQWRIEAEDDGRVFAIDASSNPSATADVPAGAVVEATGVCLLETTDTGPNEIFPHVSGLVVILRTPDDLRIVEYPTWWTTTRLVLLVAILVLALLGVVLWNRSINRVAVRRGRALAREQLARSVSELKVGERTRLAVELHDALSQNLAAVAFQVAAGEKAIGSDPESARTRIETAEQMLRSCRTELKNCLADLRSDTLEEPDFNAAVRRTLGRLASDAELAVDFGVSRRKLPDATAHAILAIVRELVSNALRHGGAKRIRVTGTVEGVRLLFSVTDDGCGFDPASAPGPREGHFGLEGIRDRVRRLGGDFSLSPVTPAGMRADLAIPLHPTVEQKT